MPCIKLPKEITKLTVYENSNSFHLFAHFLLHCETQKTKKAGNNLKPGQMLTTPEGLSEELNKPIVEVECALRYLRAMDYIKIKTVIGRLIVTITDWEKDYV